MNNDPNAVTLLNQQNVMRNARSVDNCRTAVSAIGGMTAGTLGLYGLSGFLFFTLVVLTLGALLTLRAGKDWNNYFFDRKQFLTQNFFGSLFLYVVFWTFFYGLVNVY